MIDSFFDNLAERPIDDLLTARNRIDKAIAERGITTGGEQRLPIEWNDDIRFILGRPCFTFIDLSRAFRTAGHDIPKQAEDEQAFFLHRWLNFYREHGEKWRDVANADVREHMERAKAAVEKPE